MTATASPPGTAGILPAPCAPASRRRQTCVKHTHAPRRAHHRHPRRSRTGRNLTPQSGDPFAMTWRVAPTGSVGRASRGLRAASTPLDPRVKPRDGADRGVGRWNPPARGREPADSTPGEGREVFHPDIRCPGGAVILPCKGGNLSGRRPLSGSGCGTRDRSGAPAKEAIVRGTNASFGPRLRITSRRVFGLPTQARARIGLLIIVESAELQ